MPNKAGFEPGQFPFPRPTGLDLFLTRDALGMSQRTMAFELMVNVRRVTEWERAGAALLIPHRLVAWRLAILMLEAEVEQRGSRMLPLSEIYQKGGL